LARSKEKKTYSDFENEINAGKLQPVYYVAVSDNYFLRKAEELLRVKITGSKDSRESFFIKYADETSGEEIIDLCRNFSSLFSASKIVIVKRCEKFGKKLDAVLEYVQNPDPDTTLLLAFDKEYVTEKKLEKEIQFYDFTDLPDDNFRAWVKSEFQIRGCSIEPAELDVFISEIPRNFDLVENEISKISNYCEEVSEGHQIKVTKEILYKFTGYDTAYSPEELMSSILRKDAKNAIEILDNMLNKGGISEIYLLNIITGYYMDLMSAKTKGFDSADYGEIYSKYKIWGDRVNFVKNYKNQVNDEDFEQIYAKILETDQKLKTSMLDSKVLITSLVEELANI
jgi:DNA polymerase III delta subunit